MLRGGSPPEAPVYRRSLAQRFSGEQAAVRAEIETAVDDSWPFASALLNANEQERDAPVGALEVNPLVAHLQEVTPDGLARAKVRKTR